MSGPIADMDELFRLADDLKFARRDYKRSTEDKTLPVDISPGTAARRMWNAHIALDAWHVKYGVRKQA